MHVLLKRLGDRERYSVSLLTLVFLLAGCSRGRLPRLVEITGNDDMKFDVTSFQVKPGETVTVTMTNVGRMPKAGMAHNWVLLKKGTDAAKFAEAGEQHPQTEYIAPDHEPDVLAKTKLLGPGDSDSVTFAAPTQPGEYQYICTFPEHYPRGMRGVMTVVSK
jgi:azurin